MEKQYSINNILSLTCFLIILTFFQSSELFAKNKKCNELLFEASKQLSSDNFGKVKLNIDILDNRKWSKALIHNLVELRKNDLVVKKRVKVNGIIGVEIDNKFVCEIKAKIRGHGDYYDHYVEIDNQGKPNFKKPYKLPSLRVELINGNIFGITEFALLKPITRNFENEIFVANLFKELGFLSPRTAFATINFRDEEYKFIFQETINKEFLENNNLVESSIYSGDERLVFDSKFQDSSNKYISLHKLDNRGWSKNNSSKILSSIYGLSLLNFLNISHDINVPEHDLIDYYTITKEKKLEKYFEDFPIFDALSYATDAFHNLSRDDRRFYHDYLNNKFVPIYYDGMSSLLNKDYKPLKNKLNEKETSLSNSALEGVSLVRKKLSDLDISSLKESLHRSGLIIEDDQIIKIIENIFINLDNIQNVDEKNITTAVFNEKNKNDVLDKTSLVYDYLDKSIFYLFSTNQSYFKLCDLKFNNCLDINLTKEEIKNLLSQKLILSQKRIKKNNMFLNKFSTLIYLGPYKNYNDFDKIVVPNRIYPSDIIKINDSSIMELYGSFHVRIDEEKKEVFLKEQKHNSRAIFTGGHLKGWDIYYDNSSNKENVNKIEHDALITGCLTFVDIIGEDLNIFSQNSMCEDAVNFIRFNGTINSISVKQSKSDGIDFDFSNASINEIKVENVGNDCLDFSYGRYNIKNINVTECGDKAVSIGENSVFNSEIVNIKKSNIGIASKDSSESSFNNVLIDNTKTCLSSYNKKQEFNGSYLKINNLSCFNYLYLKDVDKISSIEISKIKESQISTADKNIIQSNKNLISDYETYSKKGLINYINEVEKNTLDKWEVSKITGYLERKFIKGLPGKIIGDKYPANFGLIPNTLLPLKYGGDGNPLKAILIGDNINQGEIVETMPLGVIKTSYLGENNHKIILIKASNKKNIDQTDIYKDEIIRILDWFKKNTKDFETKFIGIGDYKEANFIIKKANKDYKKIGIKKR